MRLNDCVSQGASSGLKCVAQINDSGDIGGYVEESCHDVRLVGLDDSTMVNRTWLMTTITTMTAQITKIQLRTGPTASECHDIDLKCGSGVDRKHRFSCTGVGGEGYQELNVAITSIKNAKVCKKVNNKAGGFKFYNTTASTSRISASNSGSYNSHSRSDISSSSSSSSSSGSSSSLAVGTIVGIGCGTVIIVVVIIVLAWCFWKRNKRSEAANTPSMQHPFLPRGSAWTGGPTDDSEVSTLGPGLWNDNVIVANRVPRDNVTVQNLICRGGFGEIYRGTYNREPVAIKMLFPEMRSDLKKVNAFLAEAKLMAGLIHPHIVQFVGVAWGSLTDLCVLSELMEGGDLRALLKEYEAQGHPQGINDDKIRIAYQIAQALTYLHSLSPIVIHRDLKSKNVLLTEDLDAKVTDFGVSRERHEYTMTAGVGTMLWMAPEVMMAKHHYESADIFSFGVLLSELALQTLPYAHARIDSSGKKVSDAVILQKVSSGSLQVAFSTACLASVVKLAKECVALDPSYRPSAPMVVFRLQTIMKESFGEEYTI